jgi:hypothetical protein
MDTHVPGWLWPIIAFGGLGTFIDFVIGRGGQAKVRDFLLNWWVKFADVNWNNFAKKEAKFATTLLENIFGKSIFGIRRFIFVILLYLLSSVIGFSLAVAHQGFVEVDLRSYPQPYIFAVIISIVGFYASISFVISVTRGLGKLCGRGKLSDVLILAIVMVISFLLITGWEETIFSLKSAVINAMFGLNAEMLTETLMENLVYIWSWDGLVTLNPLFTRMLGIYHLSYYGYPVDYAFTLFSVYILGILPAVIRLLISVSFFLVVVFRPAFVGPISLLWARSIESEKPIFTLIFGGASAAGATVVELTRHL